MGVDQRVRIAIFASGTGTNARELIRYFNGGQGREVGEVTLVVCNKPGAGVIGVAKEKDIDVLIIEKDRFFSGDSYLPILLEKKIQLIVLAGFLWKIPDRLLAAFPRAIVNIHPALLPKFGGKGMYGMKVHQAVLEAGESRTGITIHLVDGHYDNGDILFQASCEIVPGEGPESIAQKVHELEHAHFSREVEKLALTLRSAT